MTIAAISRIIVTMLLTLAVAASVASVTAKDKTNGKGLLNTTLIEVDEVNDPIITLEVLIERTDLTPTGVAFNDPLDPDFAGDFDAILLSNGLTRFDVFDVLFDRKALDPVVDVTTTVEVVVHPGTDYIGDIEDPQNITVVCGQVDINTIITTTTTPRFDDTLTIQLYKGAEPNPVTTLDLCPPPNGDGRIDACDLLLLIEAMRGGTIPERELFAVSREWLDEAPIAQSRGNL
ncbi:MAG: hypothetical protein KC978_08425 [Candidatus Omnitrophica bacterium]|nr:hypothetical protein [Candidatus Omnitrophota bacterium]